jgi:hypothetical protein
MAFTRTFCDDDDGFESEERKDEKNPRKRSTTRTNDVENSFALLL